MTVRCPAKVNTFLSVGPRDERGYHPVRTVYQATGLFDELRIELAGEDAIVSDWSGLPSENTLTKALRFLRELANLPPLSIALTKRIPAQSGLGGGSSDAAGVIRAARRMLPEQVSESFAHEVACAVGSDVPFFLVGGRAQATGYGEVLEPLADGPQKWLVIVKPAVGVDTGEAYERLDSAPRQWAEFSSPPINDFERVAPCECGEIAERLALHGASIAMLCGSGSAVFGAFVEEVSARAAAERLAGEGIGEIFVAPTLSREESLWTS